jgi:hypothetical protein
LIIKNDQDLEKAMPRMRETKNGKLMLQVLQSQQLLGVAHIVSEARLGSRGEKLTQ